MKFQSKKDLTLVSATANIDFAAAKKIVMSVGGGASITIDGGITVKCPGTITVHASKKSFSGPTSTSYEFKSHPNADYDEGFVVVDALTGKPIEGFAYRIRTEGGQTLTGRTAADGSTAVLNAAAVEAIYLEPDLTPMDRPVNPKASS
jgi:uncharacterized protein (DUF2345 family)